jgi:DNA-binding transcriptional LysR family regulator
MKFVGGYARTLYGVGLNFRPIEAFNAVMSAGTTTGAASLLKVSQPAISRLIGQLEHATKLRLFNRINGRLVPTQEGLLFHREVARSFTVLDRLKTTAADIRSYGTGSLRVAALPALGFSLIPRAIGSFLEQHPQHVSVLMETGNSETVRELVASGQFDVGFAAEEIETASIITETFAMPPAVCVLPKGHRLAQRNVVHARDLHRESFVTLSRNDRARRRIDAALSEAGVEVRIAVETHYALSVCQFVQNGAGVGLINPYSLTGVSLDGIDVRPFAPTIRFHTLMIFPPQHPPSELASGFARTARGMAQDFLDEALLRVGLDPRQVGEATIALARP